MTDHAVGPDPILAVSDLAVSFGGVDALRGVSLSVGPGEIVAIIGPNGAGKTTLVNCLTAVVKADRGSIRLDGEEVAGLLPQALVRRGLGRTFQNVGSLSGIGVRDLLLLGREHELPRGVLRYLLPVVNGAERRAVAAVSALGERLGIAELVRDNPSVESLPYGVRKVIDIGRAMATDPRVLLLDEPVAGLNGEEADRVRDVMFAARQSGISQIVIEHDLGFVGAVADRVIVVATGEVITEGRYEDVLAHPDVVERYLGVPVEGNVEVLG